MLKFIKSIATESVQISFFIFKIMIPVSIIIKILKEFSLIAPIGNFLAPVMKLVGLPGDYGLVWATAIITNIYGGILVFFNVFASNPITVAQVTVLGTMILVAHSFPVELTISRKAGVSLRALLVLRLGGAFIFGFLINIFYNAFDLYQDKIKPLWTPHQDDGSLLSWVLGELKNYGTILIIILLMITMMRTLERLKVIDFLSKLLSPVLVPLGISRKAAPITMIGMTLGLAYGGGLIVKEAKSGNLDRKDIFFSIALLSLSHSLIEDTLLMTTVGCSLTGLLLARVILSFLVISTLVRFSRMLSKPKLDKCAYFVLPPSQ